jgi:hypothetical protein
VPREGTTNALVLLILCDCLPLCAFGCDPQIILCSVQRGEQAAREIRVDCERAGRQCGKLESMELDLSSFASIRRYLSWPLFCDVRGARMGMGGWGAEEGGAREVKTLIEEGVSVASSRLWNWICRVLRLFLALLHVCTRWREGGEVGEEGREKSSEDGFVRIAMTFCFSSYVLLSCVHM